MPSFIRRVWLPVTLVVLVLLAITLDRAKARPLTRTPHKPPSVDIEFIPVSGEELEVARQNAAQLLALVGPLVSSFSQDEEARGPDPCASHRTPPDFDDEKFAESCKKYGLELGSKECYAHLELSWMIGDSSVHEDFALPDGCLP